MVNPIVKKWNYLMFDMVWTYHFLQDNSVGNFSDLQKSDIIFNNLIEPEWRFYKRMALDYKCKKPKPKNQRIYLDHTITWVKDKSYGRRKNLLDTNVTVLDNSWHKRHFHRSLLSMSKSGLRLADAVSWDSFMCNRIWERPSSDRFSQCFDDNNTLWLSYVGGYFNLTSRLSPMCADATNRINVDLFDHWSAVLECSGYQSFGLFFWFLISPWLVFCYPPVPSINMGHVDHILFRIYSVGYYGFIDSFTWFDSSMIHDNFYLTKKLRGSGSVRNRVGNSVSDFLFENWFFGSFGLRSDLRSVRLFATLDEYIIFWYMSHDGALILTDTAGHTLFMCGWSRCYKGFGFSPYHQYFVDWVMYYVKAVWNYFASSFY